jgi:hypothetical protein
MTLENHARELRESEQARSLATWNVILAGATLIALVFGLDDKIGIGIGLAIILLWNVGALIDRHRRVRAAFERDKTAAKSQN